jgi:hypothetical protein
LFTALVPGGAEASTVELFEVAVDGTAPPTRLTTSPPGTTHYHPRPSPDGAWLLYGSHRAAPEGGRARNLFARRLHDGVEAQLTQLPAGRAAMHGHWQPAPRAAAAAGDR